MKPVVCALIVHEGQLLIVQHDGRSGHPYQWEFPGGKIRPDETPERALEREVHEELLISIRIDAPLVPVMFRYPGKDIYLRPFLCAWTSGDLVLVEHHASLWIDPREVFSHPMLAADLEMLNREDNYLRLLAYAGCTTEESKQNILKSMD